MKRYTDCPQVLREFLIYHETIKGQSPKTISEYYLDLRMFLRFIKLMRHDMPIHTRLDDIDVKNIDIEFIRTIDTTDIFDFLSYLANVLPRGRRGIYFSASVFKPYYILYHYYSIHIFGYGVTCIYNKEGVFCKCNGCGFCCTEC